MRVHLILDAEVTTLGEKFTQEMSRSIRTAILNAIILAEQEGYTHPMENKIAIEVKEISGALEGSGQSLLLKKPVMEPPKENTPIKFMVFCQQVSGGGTIWIDSVEADSVEQAEKLGRERCANDWQWDTEQVHVLGIAKGDVEIVSWDDLPE